MKIIYTTVYVIASVLAIFAIGYGMTSFMGAGALKRHITMSGVYAVCKPSGYDVVCFLDADSKDGGANCLPLKDVGGTCK